MKKIILSAALTALLASVSIYLLIFTPIPLHIELVPWFILNFTVIIIPAIFIGYYIKETRG